MKKDVRAKRKDFKTMRTEDWSKLNDTIGETLETSRPQGHEQDRKDDIDARLKHMNKSIQTVIDMCSEQEEALKHQTQGF